MIRSLLGFIVGLASAGVVVAGVTALTVVDTDLKEQPDDASLTLVELAEGSVVELGNRQGAWYEASTESASGWMRMLNVRLSSGQQRPGGAGVQSLLQVGRTDATVTTGVRGLTVEDLKHARENRAALQTMAAMQPASEDVDAFAADGELFPGEVDDPEPPARGRGSR